MPHTSSIIFKWLELRSKELKLFEVTMVDNESLMEELVIDPLTW